MIVVDASVWVAWLTSTDSHHAASRDWLARWLRRAGTISIPQLAVIEVAGAIARRSGSPALAKRAAETVMAFPGLHVYRHDAQLFTDAIVLAANRRLRGADAVYVAVARSIGVPLLSWDTQQLERASAVVKTMRPGDPPHQSAP